MTDYSTDGRRPVPSNQPDQHPGPGDIQWAGHDLGAGGRPEKDDRDIRPVEEQLVRLDGRLRALEQEVSSLAERLRPVLASEVDGDDLKGDAERDSNLGIVATRIFRQGDAVSSITETVCDLLRRLEV